MSKMSFTFKNINVSGDRKYKLIGFSLMSFDELPNRYITIRPRVYKINDHLYVKSDEREASYKIGSIISQDEMQWFHKTVQDAGEVLYKINKEIRESMKNWEGKEWTFTI